MDENKTDLMKVTDKDLFDICTSPTAFNTLQKHVNLHPRRSRRLSKIEEEKPCDTKDEKRVPKKNYDTILVAASSI